MNHLKKLLHFLNQKYTANDKPNTIKYLIAFSSIAYILYPKFYYTLLLWKVSPFLLFVPSIIISSWYGGFLPGIFTTLIGILIGDYFFLHPFLTLTISDPLDSLRVILFSTIGILISLVSQRFHNERIRAQRALNALKLSEETFRQIANNAPVMIWLTDQTGNYIFFNQQWLDFRGKTKEEELDNKWMKGIHIDDIKKFRKRYLKAYTTKTKFTIEYRLKNADGKFHWIMDTAAPRFDAQNNFIGYIGTCVDISDKKTIEEQKSNFLSVVAHELKTPITIIRVITYNLTEIYKKIIDPEMLKDLSSELERITILVEDLLDISKIERGKLTINKTQMDLTQTITEVINRVNLISKNHTITFSQQNHCTIQADETRIKQILVNLIENAIKHSPPQTQITVDLQATPEQVTVSVKDQGEGIDKKQQKQIFDIFYQVKNRTTQGFGLGLYISKEIVTLHQGKIWLNSNRGQGSTFYFSLPAH